MEVQPHFEVSRPGGDHPDHALDAQTKVILTAFDATGNRSQGPWNFDVARDGALDSPKISVPAGGRLEVVLVLPPKAMKKCELRLCANVFPELSEPLNQFYDDTKVPVKSKPQSKIKGASALIDPSGSRSASPCSESSFTHSLSGSLSGRKRRAETSAEFPHSAGAAVDHAIVPCFIEGLPGHPVAQAAPHDSPSHGLGTVETFTFHDPDSVALSVPSSSNNDINHSSPSPVPPLQ